MEPVNLYQWVNDNNPAPELEYGNGWWDYIEFRHRVDELYGRTRPRSYRATT